MEEGLKYYFKYLSDNKYLLRVHNMHDNKNVTLDLKNLNVTPSSLSGVKTFEEMEI